MRSKIYEHTIATHCTKFRGLVPPEIQNPVLTSVAYYILVSQFLDM